MNREEEALLRTSNVLELRRPSQQVYAAFCDHFGSSHTAKPFTKLAGVNATLYDSKQELASLAHPCDDDRLTTLLRDHFPYLFRRRAPPQKSVESLSESRLALAVIVTNILVASALLFGAIYNLYYVKDQAQRLGILAAYTIAFALCVGLFTNARRSEIFGACAAYAAVLVVFVSGNLGEN